MRKLAKNPQEIFYAGLCANYYRSLSNLRRKMMPTWSRCDCYSTKACTPCILLSCIKIDNLKVAFLLSIGGTNNKKLTFFGAAYQ